MRPTAQEIIAACQKVKALDGMMPYPCYKAPDGTLFLVGNARLGMPRHANCIWMLCECIKRRVGPFTLARLHEGHTCQHTRLAPPPPNTEPELEL